MSGTFTMYTTPWCGYCHRLKSQLDREGIAYDIVDIEQTPDAADDRRVRQQRQPDRADPGVLRRHGADQPVADPGQGRSSQRSLALTPDSDLTRSPVAGQRPAVPVLDQ